MRRSLLFSLALITLLLPTQSFAQTDEILELSLEDAMKYAVRNNYSAKNARLDILNQKAVNDEVRGLALPNISAKGEFNDYINPVQSFVPAEFVGGPSGTFIAVPFTPKFTATASATGSQVLFDGSVMVALQARNTLMTLYEQSAQLTEQQIRYNIQKAYYSLVIAKRQQSILNESMAYIRNMANDLQAMYDNGFVEKIELDRTNVQLNNLASDSIRTGNMITVSEQLLKFQLGIKNQQQIILSDTSLDEQVADARFLLLEKMDYRDRMDYNILQTQLKLNEYDLKRHKLSALPSLGAFGTAAYTYSTNTFEDIFKNRYIFYSLVGLQLNVPIFDGLQRHNRVKQAKIAIEKTKNNIENLELNIDFQKNRATTQLKNAIITMNNEERNLQLAKSVLDLAQAKYKAGVGSNMEVSQAQTEMLSAQNNYFQSMMEVVNAQADLKQAIGEFSNN